MRKTDLCRNARIGFCYIGYTRVLEMKRIISFVLCFALVLLFSSCDDENKVLKTEQIIAAQYGAANEVACEKYVSDGFTKVTYNSSEDVVLAVENKKADFGVLDEVEFNSFALAGRNIKQKEHCEYSIDYCAYFASDNENLQALFNEAIKALNDDGTIDKIKAAHLKGESFSQESINRENGTLIMLCDPCFDKRVYTDDNGDVVGLDVDIAREICSYLGYDLEILTADFDELFMKLENGEGDFIISACEYNEERENHYLLSDIYFTLEFYLIERK